MYSSDSTEPNNIHTSNNSADDSKTSTSSQGSKDSINSTKDSLNVEYGTANDINDSDETILTITTDKRSKRKDGTKFYRYEVKKHKKMVRILTVVAYVICVSMAAIVLSLYYVFLWDPNMTKYRDVSEIDCERLIQKLKIEAKNNKDRDKLMKEAKKFVKCAVDKIKENKMDEDGYYNISDFATPYALPVLSASVEKFFIELSNRTDQNTLATPSNDIESSTSIKSKNTSETENEEQKVRIDLNRDQFYIRAYPTMSLADVTSKLKTKLHDNLLSRSGRHVARASLREGDGSVGRFAGSVFHRIPTENLDTKENDGESRTTDEGLNKSDQGPGALEIRGRKESNQELLPDEMDVQDVTETVSDTRTDALDEGSTSEETTVASDNAVYVNNDEAIGMTNGHSGGDNIASVMQFEDDIYVPKDSE